MKKLVLKYEDETVAFGAKVARLLQGGEQIYLRGELGAGKTTFVRGLLNELGHKGTVKSPTYTLVESYSVSEKEIYHFDLYRINDPEELEAMGIRDYCDGKSICLFEWPEQGGELVPPADLTLSFTHTAPGREVEIQSNSAQGETLLAEL